MSIDPQLKAWVARQKRAVKEEWEAVKDLISDKDFWAGLSLTIRVLSPCLKALRITYGKKGATLGKVYALLAKLDQLYDKPIESMCDDAREKMHQIFMARWGYFHEDVFTAAYMLDAEFFQVDHTSAEQQELRDVMKMMATEAHPQAAIIAQYAQLSTTISLETHDMDDEGAFSAHAQRLQGFEWAGQYLYPWPDLQWFVMRFTSMCRSASGCEHSWSVEGWIHSKKRNRLGQTNVERLIRTHTNLILEGLLEDWKSCILPWDIELVIDEPDQDDGDGAQD